MTLANAQYILTNCPKCGAEHYDRDLIAEGASGQGLHCTVCGHHWQEGPAPTCPTCGGTGTYAYPWSISATSKGTATVRCLACTEKPDDQWKFHS